MERHGLQTESPPNGVSGHRRAVRRFRFGESAESSEQAPTESESQRAQALLDEFPGADVVAAFDGADFTLLAVTIAIVAVLLIVTYRSPILWLVPLTALAGVLLLLPPMLVIVGRGAFWPSIPRYGAAARRDGVWRRVATAVVRHPLVSAGAGIALLAIMASGLFGVKVGLDQLDRFRVQSESAAGLRTLSQHFPPGRGAADSHRCERRQG